MRREDFYSGELVDTGSPQSFEFTTEAEAIENASFGKYDYDPGARLMQPVNIYPGGYGYNTNNSMNFMGLGYNPYQYYNPNMGGNPALIYQQQMQYYNPNMGGNPGLQYQQQMNQQVQYYIPPVNFGCGEYLPPMNYEEEIEKLKLEYWVKEQELAGQSSVKNFGAGYNPFTGNNYYGVPYYNPYQYNSLNSEISQKISEMQDQAKQNRINLNIHLATLAHNYVKDEYDQEELKERYTGKYVSNPGAALTYAEIYEQQRFNNLTPYDNSQFYREHSENISKEYHSVIPSNSNLKDCFDNMGVLYAQYELEEEKQRRRDGAALYNSDDNSYKFFVRTKAAEKYAKKNGLPLAKVVENTNSFKQNMMTGFPTLAQSAKLCDDGTLNITCNFGSHKGETYTVHNSQEASYDRDRERFQQFIDSIPNSIYLDSPNPTV